MLNPDTNYTHEELQTMPEGEFRMLILHNFSITGANMGEVRDAFDEHCVASTKRDKDISTLQKQMYSLMAIGGLVGAAASWVANLFFNHVGH